MSAADEKLGQVATTTTSTYEDGRAELVVRRRVEVPSREPTPYDDGHQAETVELEVSLRAPVESLLMYREAFATTIRQLVNELDPPAHAVGEIDTPANRDAIGVEHVTRRIP